MPRRPLFLGAVTHGAGGHGSALWRDAEVPTTASIDIRWYVQQAQEAEAAGFAFLFIVDSQFVDPGFPPHHLNRLEPLTLLSAVAIATERIGLVGTISTTYSEPFDIARRLASLDLISDGRAGWNIVTSQDPGTAGNFSRDEHGDYATRYARAAESVAVVEALWDSYEPDAFATDKHAPRFLDAAKQHRIDHRGEHFHVTGPLNVVASRQGKPVLVQAGASDHGRDLSAAVADVVFDFESTLEGSLAFNDDVRDRIRALGRDPDDVRFVPAVTVDVLDDGERLEHVADLDGALFALGRAFGGYDFRAHDLDAPFPDVPDVLGGGANALHQAGALAAAAREQRLTLREVLARHGVGTRWARFVGTADQVADELGAWHDAGAADGFNLFIESPEQWRRFRERVVPLLVDRGVLEVPAEGTTLREQLGLPAHVNRHVRARAERASAA